MQGKSDIEEIPPPLGNILPFIYNAFLNIYLI